MVIPENKGLNIFLKIKRFGFQTEKSLRKVYISHLLRNSGSYSLESYFADKIPIYYRDIFKIANSLKDGYFLTAIKETLLKLPDSKTFIESHFCEVASSVFAEEIIGLRKVYSKLSLLTSENANAYKMDLVLYDPKTNPIQFVFAEVKSSPKDAGSGLPAGHDKSCFADIFNTLNDYSKQDFDFDLGAAKDRIDSLPEPDQTIVRTALQPYSNTSFIYAAFAVIDASTRNDDEVGVLSNRKNDKSFDVDLICIDELAAIASKTYKILDEVKKSCSV